MNARELSGFWDKHTARWLDGEDPIPEPLGRWWSSYRGRGAGQPTRDCFAEPYIGPLNGDVTVVTLGLNPGRAHPELQARDGDFAQEIRACGSYAAWAAPNPYLGDGWSQFAGAPNRYHHARQRFARDWSEGEAADPQVLTFELYPWHSTRVTGAIRPPSDVIHDFVWAPIFDLGARLVFAFGRPWVRVCEALGLAPAKHWAAGDPGFPTRVRSRVIQTYHLPDGGRVVVCWQSGYAGPPGREDTLLLRDLLSL